MEFSEIAQIISGILIFIGYIPYILGVIKKEIKPNTITWLVWGLLNLSALVTSYLSGSGTNAILITSTIGSFVISIMSIKYGKFQFSKLNIFCLGLGVLSFLALFLIKSAEIALGIAIFGNIVGSIPTITSVYINPKNESIVPWSIYVMASIFDMISLSDYSFLGASYHFYLFSNNILMVLLILRGNIKK